MLKRRRQIAPANANETSPASPASVTDFGSNDALNELLLDQPESGEMPAERSEEDVDPATLTPEEQAFWAEHMASGMEWREQVQSLGRAQQRQLRTKRRPRGRKKSASSSGNRTPRYYDGS